MSDLTRRQFVRTAGTGVGAGLVGIRSDGAQESPPTKASLTLACADYLRFTPLATGDVRPADFELSWLRGARSEMLRRVTSDPAVDGGEGSMLAHLLRIGSGDRSLVAVPVFVLRNFTARDLYTRRDAPRGVATLAGSRIGIYNWAASGAVWYRHLVRWSGSDPASIRWVVGGPDEAAAVEARAPLPPHVSNAPPDRSLTDLLLAGELDAFFAPLPPRRYGAGDGPIVRAVSDYRIMEQRYFRETACYPPQHVLLLRAAIWSRDPAIGRRLVETFQACEERFSAGQRQYPYATPWLIGEVEETERLMGADWHAHGLEKNRHAVDTFCQAAFDDGLTARRVTVEEYFAEFLAA